MSDTNIELTSTISEDNKLELALREIEIPQPGENQVVIRVITSYSIHYTKLYEGLSAGLWYMLGKKIKHNCLESTAGS